MKSVILSSSKENTSVFENAIDKVLMATDYHYECYKFDANNKEFYNFLTKQELGIIYIIENSKEVNALEVMREIRLEQKDTKSFVIIIDFYNKIKPNDLNEIFIFNNVLLNDKNSFKKEIDTILRQLFFAHENNCHALEYKYSGTTYKIPFSSILYIEKVPNSKVSIINCKIGKYEINKSLKEIKSILDDRFIRPDRFTIINIENIIKYDKKAKEIIYKSQTSRNVKNTQFIRNQFQKG